MAQKLDVRYVHYYTDGSTARKAMPAFPAIKTVLPKPRVKKVRRIKLYVDPVAILGIVVAVIMLIAMAAGVSQLRQAQQQNLQLQQAVEYLTQENATLQQQYADSYDIKEVEQTALALGMIPQEQAPRITISVPQPAPEPDPTVWEEITTFLTGLFA